MDPTKKDDTSSLRIVISIIGLFVLMLLISLATMVLVYTVYLKHDKPCQLPPQNTLHFTEKPEWTSTSRLNIEEKHVTVIRTLDRCYVTALNEHNEERVYSLIHEQLSDEMLDELAGPYASMFCQDQPTYLLREVNQAERSRQKRQSSSGHSGSKTAAINLPYEQRNPRCMDMVLDCASGNLGQVPFVVQGCFTWINGVIEMNQRCLSPTQFQVQLTKPPGRMLKISVQQWKICVERRKQGLRC